jgi:transposase
MLFGMAGKSRRAKLVLTREEVDRLERVRRSQTAPRREARRAEILRCYQAGETITEIARKLSMTRTSVGKWVAKALNMGVAAALKDSYHRPREPVITEAAKAWVVHLACSQPKEYGYAAELWTRYSLARHVRRQALAAGHPSLARAAKATVHRILTQQALRPEKVTYYLERRDPAFEAKMREVLLVYQEVMMQNQIGGAAEASAPVITVSVDEKPGLQALANTAPDLPPVAGEHPTVARDHEYQRLGTASILAALDLHTGHVTARVERRHRSREFIALLQDLDRYYPPDCTIRLVLDNHSAHLSKQTQAYLSTRPNRFKYVLTPSHGSWLNIAETLLGKMARTFLRHIRVQSWEEFRDRIRLGISEINAEPVVHRWKKFDALMTT